MNRYSILRKLQSQNRIIIVNKYKEKNDFDI